MINKLKKLTTLATLNLLTSTLQSFSPKIIDLPFAPSMILMDIDKKIDEDNVVLPLLIIKKKNLKNPEKNYNNLIAYEEKNFFHNSFLKNLSKIHNSFLKNLSKTFDVKLNFPNFCPLPKLNAQRIFENNSAFEFFCNYYKKRSIKFLLSNGKSIKNYFWIRFYTEKMLKMNNTIDLLTKLDNKSLENIEEKCIHGDCISCVDEKINFISNLLIKNEMQYLILCAKNDINNENMDHMELTIERFQEHYDLIKNKIIKKNPNIDKSFTLISLGDIFSDFSNLQEKYKGSYDKKTNKLSKKNIQTDYLLNIFSIKKNFLDNYNNFNVMYANLVFEFFVNSIPEYVKKKTNVHYCQSLEENLDQKQHLNFLKPWNAAEEPFNDISVNFGDKKFNAINRPFRFIEKKPDQYNALLVPPLKNLSQYHEIWVYSNNYGECIDCRSCNENNPCEGSYLNFKVYISEPSKNPEETRPNIRLYTLNFSNQIQGRNMWGFYDFSYMWAMGVGQLSMIDDTVMPEEIAERKLKALKERY